MPFLTDDVAVNITPAGLYVLTAPLVYRGRDDTFTVPAGYVTDLATVPRFLTWLVPVAGDHDRAAIVHDNLCSELERRRLLGAKYLGAGFHYRYVGDGVLRGTPRGGLPPGVTARDADGIFRRILRELGVPVVRRWLFWVGVRWGALFTPARRPGWWRDAPAVVGITLLGLPVIAPAAVCVGLALAVDTAVETVAGRLP